MTNGHVLLQDIRTFVAVDETALAATHPSATEAREIWGYYPDDSPLKGLHAGDTRAALAPFLAHQVWAWHQTLPNPTKPFDAAIKPSCIRYHQISW